MKIRVVITALISLLLCHAGGRSARAVDVVSSLPDAATVISNVVARAEQVARQTDKSYFFLQTSVIEKLDSKGSVEERKEKLYEVIFSGGKSRLHLIKVDGKDLPAKAIKSENAKDHATRQSWEDDKPARKGDKKEILLTTNLVDRFVYTVEKREILNSRPTLVISFVPRSTSLPVKKTSDRVINKLTGTLWVDEADYEISQVDVHLSDQVSFWGGLIGSIDTFNLTLSRCRTPDGVWFNRLGSVFLEGRKLFSSMHFRAKEESSGFRKLETSAQAQ